MSSLLPPNATQLERDLEATTARTSDLPAPMRNLWNSQACPANLLPWLAWALSVDEWNPDWSDIQKRSAIEKTVEVHRIKGTIGAVRKAIDALGIDVRVQEWSKQTPQGAPHSYKVLLQSDQTPVTQDGINNSLRLADANKAVRSSLSEVEVSSRSEAATYIGAASVMGSEIAISVQPSPLFINELAIAG